MDRPLETWHVPELKRFFNEKDVSIKGLKLKVQLVERAKQVPHEESKRGTAAPENKKSDVDLRNKNSETFRFLPSEKEMEKDLKYLPPFTFNSIVKYIRNSGKSIQQAPDYMVLKPFERGANFFIEGYIHNVLAKFHSASETFYFRARCYRSLRKNEAPHKLCLAISTKGPSYDILGSSCSCVAGALGFCNHAVGLMYLVSHYYVANIKLIPDDLACTSFPQQWNKPRGKTIAPEPLMDIVFKKPKLDPVNMQQCAPKKKHSPGIACTLYHAVKVPPTHTEIENLKNNLQDINKSYGLSLYLNVNVEDVQTKMGLAPVGGYLSYQLAPIEGNFEVNCNVELSNNCSFNNLLSIYPPFPISIHCPDFTITQCTKEHQSLHDSLQVGVAEAAVIEQETILQHQNCRWWSERKHRITASQFKEVLHRKSVTSKFLKEVVDKEERKTNINNLPAPLRHGIENESKALDMYKNYLKNCGYQVKVFPSGFVVNPAYPFLGCSPDAKVIDEAAQDCPFGIIEIKCPYKHKDVTPLTACNGDKDFHLEIKNNFPVLKTSHRYYYQVQGQLGITGSKWCDFITYTFKGMVIERIVFNVDTFISMLLKLEDSSLCMLPTTYNSKTQLHRTEHILLWLLNLVKSRFSMYIM